MMQMGEVRDTEVKTTDVAGELVAALEADGALVDAGRFTLDVARGRTKLANYRLADPQEFVVLLVAAAHVLPGCTRITFEFDIRETRVVFEGATLSAHELSRLFDAVFEDLGGDDDDRSRSVRARRYLAVALETVLGQPRACARLTTAGLRSSFTSSGSGNVEQVDERSMLSSLELVITDRFWTSVRSGESLVDRRRELLSTRCRFAHVPVLVDGVRLDCGAAPPAVAEPVELRDDDGRVVGLAGWSRFDPMAKILWTADGVVVETVEMPHWMTSFFAVVDANDLPRDLSLTKLQRSVGFERRLGIVEQAHDALAAEPYPGDLPVRLNEGRLQNLGTAWWLGVWPPLWFLLACLSVVFAVDGGGFWVLVGAVLVGAGFVGLAETSRAARRAGESGIATVVSRTLCPEPKRDSRTYQLLLRVEVAYKPAYDAVIRLTVDTEVVPLISIGARLWIRADPIDPSNVTMI